MAATFDNIVQHLFHQPSLHSVTVDELQNMTKQHPYFAAAHFLLLKKMQDAAHPSFTEQLQKTTIYFNNPLWLQYLLQPETLDSDVVSGKTPPVSNGSIAETADVYREKALQEQEKINAGYNNQLKQQGQNTIVQSEEVPANSESIAEQAHGSMMDVIDVVFEDQPAVHEPPVIEESHKTVEQVAEPAINEIKHPETEALVEHMDPAAETSTDDEHIQPVEHDVSFTAENNGSNNVDSYQEQTVPVDIVATEPAGTQQEYPIETENVLTGAQPVAEATAMVADEDSHSFENTDTIQEEQITREQDLSEDNLSPDATEAVVTGAGTVPEMPDRPLLRTVIETEAAKDDLLFEPYHTVDYFASQGIKLGKTDIEPKDKLGRQLKSFTDWLKTMKRLPQASIDKILSENEETKVVQDAIHSIENKEVITETMAEVFEKQGLHNKATEIYQKLSLLNPSKSAYFAARIEALKN